MLHGHIIAVLGSFSEVTTRQSCELDPTLPTNLTAHAAQQPLCAGFIDATAPPFSAAGDGVTDDTDALQAALDEAYAAKMAVILPGARTFLVSRQLRAVEEGMPVKHRATGYQLVGGSGVTPPVIKVADGAEAANFPSLFNVTLMDGSTYQARPMMRFALLLSPDGDNDASSLYSALLRNVIIDLGNNPPLSAVSMSGAQLCSIEDVLIRGTAFTAGVVGLPGSGGYTANLEVEGGMFAIWQNQFRANPLVTGFVAVDQRVAAVLLENSRGPLVLSGFVIRSGGQNMPPSAFGAVLLTSTKPGGDASIALEDGSISRGNQGDARIDNVAAISNYGRRDVSLRSVWIRSSVAISVGPSGRGLKVRSDPDSFRLIDRWSFSSSNSIAWSRRGNVSSEAGATGLPSLQGLPGQQTSSPPTENILRSMHSWNATDVKDLIWSDSIVDAWRDCGATPDWVNDTDDDGAALKTCFDKASVVFLPRGNYLMTTPVILAPGKKLVGAGKHCTQLFMDNRQDVSPEDGALLTIDGSSSAVSEAAMVTDVVLVQSRRSILLEVRGKALIRDVRTVPCTRMPNVNEPTCKVPFSLRAAAKAEPIRPLASVLFTGRAAGRFYGLSLDHSSFFLGEVGDALLAVNTSVDGDGIHIYQLSAEHLVTNYQVQLWRSSNVHFHAFKFEPAFKFESAGFPNHPNWGPYGGGLLGCRSSSNVSVFGGSGNFGIMNATLAVNIVFAFDCNNLRLDAMVRKPIVGETPPRRANWITTMLNGGRPIVIDDHIPAILSFSAV